VNIDGQLAATIEAAIAGRIFPGCVVGYVREGRTTVLPFGHFTYEPGAIPVQASTRYDVASITKSIPTASLILKFVEEGRLHLDHSVIRYIPELTTHFREQVLIRHLLTYTMILNLTKGPSAHVREGMDAANLWELLYQTELKAPPGQQYLYSNAPAVFLGLVAERVSGRPLDELAQGLLFDPLGMTQTTFHPETLRPTQVAPTEIDWRGEIQGQVHDEMAWAFRRAGYIAGHAGLFTTAGDLLTFAEMLLEGGTYGGRRYFQPETITQMHTNQIAALGETTGLGWELGQSRFMGHAVSDQAFGKTGFTGSLILIDPMKHAAMVLLSNRIYPQRPASRESINEVRSAVADIVFG
jgi:CubicO group peptidase (beta-lactamase class C family)